MTVMPKAGALLLLMSWPASALANDWRQPNALSDAVIESGHSLTDVAMFKGDWPGHGPRLVAAAAAAAGVPAGVVDQSTIPGSPMDWRRNNEPGYGAPDAWNDMGNYDAIVLTENNLTTPESLFPSGWEAELRQQRRDELLLWVNRAGELGTPSLLYYSVWPAQGDYPPAASWRARLEADEVEWLARADYADANRNEGAPRVWVIPGVPLMMRLWDDAEAGLMPGVSSGADFLASERWWEDPVHSNGLASLALAYLHIMVLYHVDPRTLPHDGLGLSHAPTAAEAAYIKDVVYDVVVNYPRAGVPPLR